MYMKNTDFSNVFLRTAKINRQINTLISLINEEGGKPTLPFFIELRLCDLTFYLAGAILLDSVNLHTV